MIAVHICSTHTGEGFDARHYNLTISPGTTQATADIPLPLENLNEYFMIHLYIPSAAYKLGIQQGNNVDAMVSITSSGI